VASTPVALFGGSFNPPHIGHVLAAAYVLSTGVVERVVAVPVFEHALRKHLEPYEHRVEMARRAFCLLRGVEVSEIEAELGAPSRTLSTILALEVKHPDWALRLMVGSDILTEIHQWHAFDEIERRAPPLVLARAGANTSGAPSFLPEVSSTEVRALLARAAVGQAPDAQLRALVPSAVLDYVREHLLYGPSE
jgi:nicotinate-nucleotide adenylyltransferase